MIREVFLNGKKILSVKCNNNHEDCPCYRYVSTNKFPYSIDNDGKVETIKATVFYEQEHEKKLADIHKIHNKFCEQRKQRGV